MEVMFSGFDDGGWWLAVSGCQGVEGNWGWLENTNSSNNLREGGWSCRLREEREMWVEFVVFF